MPESSALYRRYRPQTFAAIVGQEHVTRTLKNAIGSGQVAHAYLLAGSRGIGKTTIARLIAKAVNCTKAKDGEPCDRCENCVAIRDGSFLDLIEIDAASNRGIDEMRDLRDKVRFAPSQGQYKVYVIDEAHQLTSEAFNALLKTLEEPPPHAIFVLATTESGKIPATIVSRTQRFDLRRIPYKGVVAQLAKICEQEGLKVEPAALEAIARHAQGSLRDAESVLEMVAAFSDGGIKLADVDELLGVSEWEETSALFDALAANDGAAGVRIVGRLVDEGRDLRLFVKRAIDHTRALVLANAQGKPPETASEGVSAKIWEQAPKFPLPRLAAIAKRLIETEQHLKTSEGTPLPLELAILDLVTQPGAPGPGTQAPTKREAAPATRPAAAPAADRGTPTRAQAGALTLTDVQKAWAEMVAHVKEQSVGKASQLVKAEPVTVEGSTVVIGFDNDFARAYWQDRYRVELEQGLSERLSLTVRVRCVVQKLPADAPSAAEDPMLRAALETFRRPERILEIE